MRLNDRDTIAILTKSDRMREQLTHVRSLRWLEANFSLKISLKNFLINAFYIDKCIQLLHIQALINCNKTVTK